VIKKESKLKQFILSLDHFPATKPYIEDYYLDKMTSMYAVNFRRALIITIIYKVVIEVFNFLESSKFTYKSFISIAKIFLLFAYSYLSNIRFIREQTKVFKIYLLICIMTELCLNVIDIHYLNASKYNQRTDNGSIE
jgi:hypothetical protein